MWIFLRFLSMNEWNFSYRKSVHINSFFLLPILLMSFLPVCCSLHWWRIKSTKGTTKISSYAGNIYCACLVWLTLTDCDSACVCACICVRVRQYVLIVWMRVWMMSVQKHAWNKIIISLWLSIKKKKDIHFYRHTHTHVYINIYIETSSDIWEK